MPNFVRALGEIMYDHTCNDCGDEFESVFEKHRFCRDCSEERAMQAMADMEAPEDGWRRGSDMDRL